MSTRFKKKEDEVAFMVECDQDMLRFRLTILSGAEITPQLFINSLVIFVDDYIDNPEKIFEQMKVMNYPTH